MLRVRYHTNVVLSSCLCLPPTPAQTEDSTGTHSVFANFEDISIMFHVSTLIPQDKEQMVRYSHSINYKSLIN